jgi:hypothetical protein
MKTRIILFLILVANFSLYASEPEYDHVFFDNSLMKDGYYYSKADYTSPSFILNIEKKLPVSDKEYFTPKNSLLLNYVSVEGGEWNASVDYQDWRGKEFIKEGASLDVRILVKSDTKVSELPLIAIGAVVGKDTIISSYTNIEKYINTANSGEWALIRIPLADFRNVKYTHTKEIKKVLFKQGSQDGKEHLIYIDQIELSPLNYQKSVALSPAIQARAYERHVDITWDKSGLENVKYIKVYRSSNGKDYDAVGIQDPKVGRYADYSNQLNTTFKYRITCVDYNYTEAQPSNSIEATTYYMTDEQLLDMVHEATFRYYWEGAEQVSGLSLENIPGRRNMIATGASGFGIMGIISGVERGFISRDQAVERLKKIVSFLDRAETFHGAYAHFVDGPTGKVEPFFGKRDNGADLVETSFLFQGLLTARQYFDRNTADEKIIRETITKLWENIEWDWFKKTKDSKYLYWHWSPDQEWVIDHKLIGWNETMITYLLAIASPTHGVSPEMYYTGWASQEPYAQEYRAGWGRTDEGKMYSNGNTYYGIKLDVGVNKGGPLFFTQFSYMGFDPRGIKDKYTTKDYYDVLKNMVMISYRYSLENPNNRKGYGPDCWGISVCENPWGSYGAYEAMEHNEDGTMSPAGALGSFPYTPKESMDALCNYYRNYGSFLWGEYGFRDAFHLNENWCSGIYMGLNQGAITVMMENYRSGTIWKYFMKDPDVKRMVKDVFGK